MRILVDTNILTRSVQAEHPQQQPAVDAITGLAKQGHVPGVLPQSIYEFWVVSTRPISVNGLGMTAAEVSSLLLKFEAFLEFLDDPTGLFTAWRQLVTAFAVIGKNAHDARLVAAMQLLGINQLLTFNDRDFRRFAGITVLTPADVLASSNGQPGGAN